LQPNKKRRMLKDASNLLKRQSFRELFVNIENKINLRGYIKNPIYDPPRHITVRDENILKRIAPDGGNTLTQRPKKRRKFGGGFYPGLGSFLNERRGLLEQTPLLFLFNHTFGYLKSFGQSRALSSSRNLHESFNALMVFSKRKKMKLNETFHMSCGRVSRRQLIESPY
jgi:hypothetical protein